MTTVPQAADYRKVAGERFDLLKQAYLDVGGHDHENLKLYFWKLGNSFDTMLDFLDGDPTDAAEVADIAIAQFTASLKALGGYDAAWFDDFGWWTIATQRALTRPYFSAAAKGKFTDLESNCWKHFAENAPHVWDRADQQRFAGFHPAVTDGVWNAYWAGTDASFPGPRGNPENDALAGIQNTVTNTVYLIAAQRLGVTDPEALTAAGLEYTFLSNWWWDQQPPLPWSKQPPGTLVRERVTHFFNSSLPAKGFQTDWAWTGDQGLTLGAITDRMGTDSDPRLLDLAKNILLGARTQLLDDHGVLQSHTTTGYVPGDDDADYCTGPGVFWRNALHAFNGNRDLRAYLSAPDYQAFIRVNAKAVVAGTAWPATDEPFDQLTNDVAMLVAASTLLTS